MYLFELRWPVGILKQPDVTMPQSVLVDSRAEYWKGVLAQHEFSDSADRSKLVCGVLVENGFCVISQLDNAEHPRDWIGTDPFSWHIIV